MMLFPAAPPSTWCPSTVVFRWLPKPHAVPRGASAERPGAMLSPRALGLRVWVLPTWQSLDETQVAGGCCHALVSAASLWVLWTALPLQFPFNKALAQRDYALKPHELNKPLRPELWALSILSEQWERNNWQMQSLCSCVGETVHFIHTWWLLK